MISFFRYSIQYIIVLFFAMGMFSSCYYDNLEELHPDFFSGNCDTSGTISYANDIVPILNSNCGTNTSCHSSPGSAAEPALDNYVSVYNNSATVIKSITHDPSFTPAQWMPSGAGMLDSCSIKRIEAWVNRGSPNN